MQQQLECLGAADRHEQQWKRVTATFFVEDLGLALAPKMCPDQSQAFKEVNNSQAFAIGRKKKKCFLNEPLPGAPKHVLHKILKNVSCEYDRWVVETHHSLQAA